MVVAKHEIEAALHAEKQEINAGRLKEDNPLDESEEFRLLCEACRRGDDKTCQEKIQQGININARDRFDYTPLILVSGVCIAPKEASNPMGQLKMSMAREYSTLRLTDRVVERLVYVVTTK